MKNNDYDFKLKKIKFYTKNYSISYKYEIYHVYTICLIIRNMHFIRNKIIGKLMKKELLNWSVDLKERYFRDECWLYWILRSVTTNLNISLLYAEVQVVFTPFYSVIVVCTTHRICEYWLSSFRTSLTYLEKITLQIKLKYYILIWRIYIYQSMYIWIVTLLRVS